MRLREKRNFLKHFKLIWVVQSPSQKYSPFSFHPNQLHVHRRLVPPEGRLAIVTNAGRDAVDGGGATDERTAGGRRSRVVLTPRRWRQVSQDDWRGEGGKKARSPGRARRKPLKPLRAGTPGVPVYLRSELVCFLPFAHEAMGAAGTRCSPRPLIFLGRVRCKTRARGVAGMRTCICGCLIVKSVIDAG
jgi:hypothetical protein